MIFVNVYLFWGAWQDLRKKKISNKYLWTGEIVGLIVRGYGLATDSISIPEWGLALVPGVVFLFLSMATKEKIGYGDGLVLMILGNFFMVSEIWNILQTAIFLEMCFAIILLCSKRVSREYQIPFLPFLWVSYTFLWGMNYV